MSTARPKAVKRSNISKHTLEILAKKRNLSKLVRVVVKQSTSGSKVVSPGKIVMKVSASVQVKATVSRSTVPRNLSKIEREKMENAPINEKLIAKSKKLNFAMEKP